MSLMEDAAHTGSHFLDHAIAHIEHRFGKGSAKTHPELVAVLVKAASVDLLGATLSQQLRLGLESIAENIRSDHPLMGETLEGITNGLQAIADAIGS